MFPIGCRDDEDEDDDDGDNDDDEGGVVLVLCSCLSLALVRTHPLLATAHPVVSKTYAAHVRGSS